ncbi:hypothetical protein GYT97_02305 [Lactobacillus mellis]|uniref:hypothetical protein n=1 Tax=Bombilactobacillus mellis TaxID=1218508 RepID=UPI00157FDDCF|nr:hypothetical protein [Bombilactobacillus mellis]NUG38709.1 hypothetical protein [Bombilactobacillus mellis]
MKNNLYIPKLNGRISVKVVKGIRLGYWEYLIELNNTSSKDSKDSNEKVNAGYRWTKSNHIDNNIAEQLADDPTIQICKNKIKNNGWQFNSYVTDNITFIQKPISYINNKNNFKNIGQENGGYISVLSNKINKKLFQDLGIKTNSTTIGQIELLDPFNYNNSDLSINSGVFYLVAYNIGIDKDIHSIKVYAACNGKCIQVQDLSEVNSASDVKIPRSLLDQTSNEDAMGYEIDSNFAPNISRYNSVYNDIKTNDEKSKSENSKSDDDKKE